MRYPQLLKGSLVVAGSRGGGGGVLGSGELAWQCPPSIPPRQNLIHGLQMSRGAGVL